MIQLLLLLAATRRANDPKTVFSQAIAQAVALSPPETVDLGAGEIVSLTPARARRKTAKPRSKKR
jgi:hypothetical protein